ncbi:MAG TPA: DUF3237 family protein [Chthoniobacterales bacterium]|nr:DUF3237 family protein [Chthoniobacterales bacterium]
MSGASIPRAVELVAILLIPRKAASPDQLRKRITHQGGVVSGSRLSGQVKRAFIRGQPGKEALFSITARVRILTDDGADILMVDRGEWRGSRDAFARLMANQLVAPTELYMVGVVTFATLDTRYAWLNEREFLSHAVGEGDRLKISVYESSSP